MNECTTEVNATLFVCLEALTHSLTEMPDRLPSFLPHEPNRPSRPVPRVICDLLICLFSFFLARFLCSFPDFVPSFLRLSVPSLVRSFAFLPSPSFFLRLRSRSTEQANEQPNAQSQPAIRRIQKVANCSERGWGGSAQLATRARPTHDPTRDPRRGRGGGGDSTGLARTQSQEDVNQAGVCFF